MSKSAQKALFAYMAAHLIHWLFNEAIDRESRKHNWTPGQIELAKLAVGGVMLVL
jgi:hypothetical protein